MKSQRSKIVLYANVLSNRRPGVTCCGSGRMLQGITEKVKKQAEQRMSSRFIVYVAFTKLERARDHSDSAQKHNCGTIVERYLEDEQY